MGLVWEHLDRFQYMPLYSIFNKTPVPKLIHCFCHCLLSSKNHVQYEVYDYMEILPNILWHFFFNWGDFVLTLIVKYFKS